MKPGDIVAAEFMYIGWTWGVSSQAEEARRSGVLALLGRECGRLMRFRCPAIGPDTDIGAESSYEAGENPPEL